jgi:hypothetical protein
MNFNLNKFNFGSSHGHESGHHNDHVHHNSHEHDDHSHHEIIGEVDLDKVYVPLNGHVCSM